MTVRYPFLRTKGLSCQYRVDQAFPAVVHRVTTRPATNAIATNLHGTTEDCRRETPSVADSVRMSALGGHPPGKQ